METMMLTGDMVTPTFNFKDVKTVLTFESVDKIQWCDHSNITFYALLSHGIVCFSVCNEIKFEAYFIILNYQQQQKQYYYLKNQNKIFKSFYKL